MSNVRAYKDEELINRVESLPTFKGWRKGKYAIMVRSNEDDYDRFDDKCYCFESLLVWCFQKKMISTHLWNGRNIML